MISVCNHASLQYLYFYCDTVVLDGAIFKCKPLLE